MNGELTTILGFQKLPFCIAKLKHCGSSPNKLEYLYCKTTVITLIFHLNNVFKFETKHI